MSFLFHHPFKYHTLGHINYLYHLQNPKTKSKANYPLKDNFTQYNVLNLQELTKSVRGLKDLLWFIRWRSPPIRLQRAGPAYYVLVNFLISEFIGN